MGKVSGGSKGKLSGSGDSYSITITPDENSEGNIVLKTKAGMVTDLAGNENEKANTLKQAYDTKAPTYEITNNAKGIANDEVTFDFVFSEEIQGFTSKDISVTGGSKGKLSGSGDSYSITITPDENSEG